MPADRLKVIAKTPIYAMPEFDRRKPSLLNLLGLMQLADIAILAGVVNLLPHPNPPLSKGREQEIHK
jgi:hypothetical protein